MLIDLHSHSTASDGTNRPEDVVARARAAGVDVLAVTDHDTVAGHAAATAALPAGLTLVRGAELSCNLHGNSVHLLAYLFDPHEPTLAAEMAALRDDRLRRGRAMVDALVALGVPVTWEQVRELASGETVGRPHIARAMVAAGAVASVDEAFTRDWIAAGGRAYVPRYALDPAQAVTLVSEAGGVSVLAHPRVPLSRGQVVADADLAALAAAGLTGVEVDHPEQDSSDREQLRGIAAGLGLVATGSSDDHGELTGHRLGCETTAPDAYEALAGQASGDRPFAV